MNLFGNEPHNNKNIDFTVTLSLRQMSLLCAGMLLACFFVFMAGYFLGKKAATQQFLYKIEQESLADQIYSSMCILSDNKDEIENSENNDDTDENDSLDGAENSAAEPEEPAAKSQSVAAIEIQQKSTNEASTAKKTTYCAQLAGFGLLLPAQRFAQRLNEKGYKVHVVERHSKTAKGKSVSWYQVVTQPFEEKSDLLRIVNILKKSEHLSGVQIVTA